MKRTLLTTSAMLIAFTFSATSALAVSDAVINQIVQDLTAQGYTHIEIKNAANSAMVEATGPNGEVKQVYDGTGALVQSQAGSPDSSSDSPDGSSSASGSDDGPNHDQGDDNSSASSEDDDHGGSGASASSNDDDSGDDDNASSGGSNTSGAKSGRKGGHKGAHRGGDDD